MVEENIGWEFRLENYNRTKNWNKNYETKNYFVEEMEQNELICQN